MYRKTNGVASANPSILETYMPVGRSFGTFKGLVTKIETVAAADSKSTKGTFEDKDDKKEEMATIAVELASAGLAYAKDQGNTELLAVLAISYSDIRYGDEQTAYNLALTVHNELKALGGALQDYMVSEEDLAGLKASIDAYHMLLQNTGEQDSVARTKQLAGLFQQANEHLRDHLDKLVTRIKRKEPVFFDTYTNARVIQDLGGSRKPEVSEEAVL